MTKGEGKKKTNLIHWLLVSCFSMRTVAEMLAMSLTMLTATEPVM